MSIPDSADPIALFAEWYGEAQSCGLKNPTAVTLATVDDAGLPSARMVLLKGFDVAGFVFYTNVGSRKGTQLQATRRAALCFYWAPLDKQVRVEGEAEAVSGEEADAYFASRARQSQIGAWASQQSRPLEGRFELEKRVAKFAMKYGAGTVPRPAWWSGFRIAPERIEFWREGAFRLHHRLVFERSPEGWTTQRLYP